MQENTTLIKELLKDAKHIAVIPSKVSGADSFCAGAGLYGMLSAAGYSVSFVYPGALPDKCQGLLRPENIISNVSARKLLVSVDYSDIPAASVQYSNEDGILHLAVSPVVKNFDAQAKVSANVVGFDFDTVFMLGVQSMGDLGNIYIELQSVIDKAKVINIDNTKLNLKYGYVNVVDDLADNLSLLVFRLAAFFGVSLDAKSAKALLTGMTYRDIAK